MRLTQQTAGNGVVTQSLWKGVNAIQLSPEAIEVFETATTPHLIMHNYGDGHPEYNAAVRKELEAFLKTNEIDPTKMTAGEAKQFVSDVRTSSVPAIWQFNMRVLMKAVDFAVRSLGREYPWTRREQ